MKFYVMGVVQYNKDGKKRVKIIGRKNTLTTSCDVIHPGFKIDVREVIDIVFLKLDIKPENIIIPSHIRDKLNQKE